MDPSSLGIDDAHVTGLVFELGFGSRAAFATLYDLLAPRVHALSSALLLEDRADQGTVAAFTAIWTGAGRYSPAAQSATEWAMTTALQAIIGVRLTDETGVEQGNDSTRSEK